MRSHGLFNFAHATLPFLLESVDSSPNPPSLIVTGATASMRGSVKFADFAAGKFACRAMTQSLAREFGPRGVHVAHAIIDGAIDGTRAAAYKSQINNGAPDGLLSPDAVSTGFQVLSKKRKEEEEKRRRGRRLIIWLLTFKADRGQLLAPAYSAQVGIHSGVGHATVC